MQQHGCGRADSASVDVSENQMSETFVLTSDWHKHAQPESSNACIQMISSTLCIVGAFLPAGPQL